MNELMNGNFWIYQLFDGGFGIVKANTEAEAFANVMYAYKEHGGEEYDATEIEIKNICDIGNVFFTDKPNVIEIGWTLALVFGC